MNFVHDDPEFSDMIDAVAAEGPIASGAMVYRDSALGTGQIGTALSAA